MGMDVQSGQGKKSRPSPTMNVTPLVDVALVILIIFMLVTPMLTKTFWLNLPKQDKDAEQKQPPPETDEANKPLVMTVDAKGVIRINQSVVAKEELTQRLPRMIAAKKQKVLYFDAHDDLPYAKAVEVLDLSRLGGAKSIAIITQKVAL
jgi:biopolymer transport protein ExbD/biopolymer transport protein TolR